MKHIDEYYIKSIYSNRLVYKLDLLKRICNLKMYFNMFMLNQRFFDDIAEQYGNYTYDCPLFQNIEENFKAIIDCYERLIKIKLLNDCDVEDKTDCYTYIIPTNIKSDYDYSNHIKKSLIDVIENIDTTNLLIIYDKKQAFIEDKKIELMRGLKALEYRDLYPPVRFEPDD